MHEDGVTGHRLTIIQPEVGTQSADAEDNELRPVRHAGKDGSVDQRIGRAFSADRQVSSATSDWVNLIELRYPGYPGRNDPRLLRRSSATVRSQRWQIRRARPPPEGRSAFAVTRGRSTPPH